MLSMPGVRSVALSGILLFLAGTTAFASGFILGPAEGPLGDKHRPIVEAIEAQKEIGDGNLWKIYIRASDPDGDLDKLHVTFSQPGTGSYSPDLLVQKTKMKSLNGFVLVWAKLQGGGSTSAIYGDVEIRAEDRAGNMSAPKKLEFTLSQFGGEDRFIPASGFDTGNNLGQADFPLETETDIGKAD
jgi:hypothetical protein